jgi:hypothetical protein
VQGNLTAFLSPRSRLRIDSCGMVRFQKNGAGSDFRHPVSQFLCFSPSELLNFLCLSVFFRGKIGATEQAIVQGGLITKS